MTFLPDPWSRLTAAARKRPADGRDDAAPLGFATRVVAQAFPLALESPLLRVLDGISWRALGAAAVVAIASAVFNFSPALQALEPDFAREQDPVAVVLDLR